MSDLQIIRRALISVSDKVGLVEFAKALSSYGVEILSTGGSAKKLRDLGISVTDIADYTGFPEMMGGRLKTLHPKVHGGLLQRRNLAEDKISAEENGIPPIDLLVVNLYPFQRVVSSGAEADICIENIDIGGPAMVRGAAKNHAFVTVLTDTAQYTACLNEMKEHGCATSLAFRKKCAADAYAMTASYDAAIAAWFAHQQGTDFPETVTWTGRLQQTVRYGENPHQPAAFYVEDGATYGLARAIQIQGKEISYNNLGDTDAALDLVTEFTDKPAVALIKHANPCGVALGNDLKSAYLSALACDPISAYGGIIALNKPMDASTAAEIVKLFAEVIIAPDIEDEARSILATKKNLRVLLTRSMPDPSYKRIQIRSVAGGFLVQQRDHLVCDPAQWTVATKRAPTENEKRDMLFAYAVCKHVKSNAIVYAKNEATVGVGAGQMSRVDSARFAVQKADEIARASGTMPSRLEGCVLASDAFFPFTDGLEVAINAGVTAVIQPGGSKHDSEIIEAADRAGLAMVMTGYRHFRH